MVPPPPQPEIAICEKAHDVAAVAAGTAMVRGTDGWIFRIDDLRGEYTLAPGTVEGLAKFVKAWNERGTQVALVVIPPRGVLAAAHVDRTDTLAKDFDPDAIGAAYKAAVQTLASSGAVVPDLLTAASDAKLGDGFVFRRDHHWTPEGAKLAMEAVVRGLTLRPPFTPVTYDNVFQRKRGMVGAIAHTLEKACGYEPFVVEKYSDYDSVPKWTEVTEEALLGDPPPPEVVIAGSSHTNKGMKDIFNVTGWLRAATGTDVLNIGVDGGGFSTGLLNWMDSDAARISPPKLLVWEVSGRVPAGMPDFFREAMPTMVGECSVALQTAKVTVANTEVALFFTPQKAPAKGEYVFFSASDPAFVDFRVTFETADGKRDYVEIHRSTRIPNNSRYFVSAPDLSSPLAAVKIRGLGATSAELSAKLCPAPS